MEKLSEFEKAVFEGNEGLKALIAVHGSVLLPENAQQIEGAKHVEVVARDGRRATVPAATVTKIVPSKDGAMLVGLFIDAAAGSRPFSEELAFLSEQVAFLSDRLAQLEADQLESCQKIEDLQQALEAKPAAEPTKGKAKTASETKPETAQVPPAPVTEAKPKVTQVPPAPVTEDKPEVSPEPPK